MIQSFFEYSQPKFPTACLPDDVMLRTFLDLSRVRSVVIETGPGYQRVQVKYGDTDAFLLIHEQAAVFIGKWREYVDGKGI